MHKKHPVWPSLHEFLVCLLYKYLFQPQIEPHQRPQYDWYFLLGTILHSEPLGASACR
uniref:Uncharacterized protein n=1 Tax=Arundo donax TaxID=35708 RepID=A0A0A9I878_ARUDO